MSQADLPARDATPGEPAQPEQGAPRRKPERMPTGIFKRDIDLYAASMQRRRTGILGWLLRWLLGPVTMADEDAARIRELSEQGVVVYVSRTFSALDYLVYEHTLNAHELPLARYGNSINLMGLQPTSEAVETLWAKLRYWLRGRRMPAPHTTGFLERLTQGGKSSLVFLFRPDTWFDRWLRPLWYPMESILAAQRKMEQPVFLVPLMVVMEKSAPSLRKSLLDVLMGPRLDPGRLRRLFLLLRYRHRAVVRVGEPVELREFSAREAERARRRETEVPDDAEQARKLRWVLRRFLFREQRMILGPPRKPRAKVIDRVVRRMLPDLEAQAERTGGNLAKLRAEARTCVDEIAADPDRGWVDVWKALFHWQLRHIFDGIDLPPAHQIERLKRRMRRAPVIFIPNHRSHVDYQLSIDVFDEHDIVPPLIAAGINLNFWPLGGIARRSGAFFIRRAFRGAVYVTAFRHYLAYVLREGYPLHFFIEGTRSRSGRMLPAKLGMLTMIVETLLETSSFDDLTIVPVACGYDKIVEENTLVRELSGARKEPESLLGLLSIHKVLQRRYGRLSVRLGEPISVRDFLAQHEGASERQEGGRSPVFRRAIGELGQRVVNELSRAQAVHPSALLATVLLARPEGIVTYGELLRGADRWLAWLVWNDAPLTDALSQGKDRALAEAVSLFQTGNVVKLERDPDPWGTGDPWGGVLTVDPQRRLALDYYRNTALYHLAPLVIAAWALAPGEGEWGAVERDVSFLWELLSLELQRAPGARWHEDLEHAAAFLERGRLLERSGDGDGRTYRVPERARRTLQYFRQPLAPTLESYRTALRFLALLERGGLRPRNQVLALVQYAQMELRRGRLDWPESISTAIYKNALAHFKGHAERGFQYFRRRLDSLVATGAPPREPDDADAAG